MIRFPTEEVQDVVLKKAIEVGGYISFVGEGIYRGEVKKSYIIISEGLSV